MSYLGDFRLGDTLDFKFTTRQISGAPSTLSSSPVISAYPGNSTTELTAGITLTVDFDSRTGLNNVRVVASGGNGYATATNYEMVITTGTVNSVSVVGEVVGTFSIENRRADVQFWNGTQVATPATAGVPDVNVKNVGNQTASAAAGVTFPASIASPTNITAGTITTATNLTNAPTAGDFTATMKTSIGTAVAASAVASVTGNVGGNVTGSVGSVVGAVGSVTGAVGSVTGLTASDVGAIKAKTDNLPASPAAVGSAMTLTSGERDSIGAALLKLDLSTITGEAARSVINAIRALRNKWTFVGTTYTVMKEDDSTTAWTSVVTPDASAQPITSSDPT